MAATAAGRRLSLTYNRRLSTLGRRTAAGAGAVWAATVQLDGNLDDRQAAWAARSLPRVEGAQRAAAALAASAAGSYLALEAGIPASPVVDLGAYTVERLRGLPADEVYRRSIVTVRTQLAQGRPPFEALRAGRARIEQTVRTDVALAARAATLDAGQQLDTITGWRRVVGGACCQVCASIAGQIIGTSDPMPIHPACDCTVEPVLRDEGRQVQPPEPDIDGGDRLDRDPLDAADPESLIEVHQHGELGPVIYPAGQHFDHA